MVARPQPLPRAAVTLQCCEVVENIFPPGKLKWFL